MSVFIQCSTYEATKSIIFNGNDEQARGSLGWKNAGVWLLSHSRFSLVYTRPRKICVHERRFNRRTSIEYVE